MEQTAECLEYRVKQYSFSLSRARKLPISGLLNRIRRWRELSRQRGLLSQLSDEMLKDIGISRVDALREAKRPFWDDSRRHG